MPLFRIQQDADPKLIRRLEILSLAVFQLRDAVRDLAAKHAVSDDDLAKVRALRNRLRGQQDDLQSAVNQGETPRKE